MKNKKSLKTELVQFKVTKEEHTLLWEACEKLRLPKARFVAKASLDAAEKIIEEYENERARRD